MWTRPENWTPIKAFMCYYRTLIFLKQNYEIDSFCGSFISFLSSWIRFFCCVAKQLQHSYKQAVNFTSSFSNYNNIMALLNLNRTCQAACQAYGTYLREIRLFNGAFESVFTLNDGLVCLLANRFQHIYSTSNNILTLQNMIHVTYT